MRIKEIKLFAYGELSEQAKEKAREWYQRFNADDSYWSECVIDDAKAQMNFLGFTIEDIFFSGFWSQGDGACFTGTWSAKDVDAKKLEELYPSEWLDKSGAKQENKNNAELNALALEFADIAKRFPEASATLKHHGMYYHENSVEIDCGGFEKEQETEQGDVPVWCHTDEQNFQDFARDCMRWVYRQLEKAYDWQNADEQVDENIVANGYEFTKEGERV
jgi:hypothetical protein